MTDECRCGRPTRDGADVCDTCADTFARALGDVPWIDEQIEITMSGQRALPTEGAARGTETPLPWNEAAGDARRTLHGLLVTWVRFCEEEHVPHQSPKDGLPDDNLPALSRWLLWRVDGLARRDIGAEAVDEITDAVAACHRVIDRSPQREFVGPCQCGKDLYRRAAASTVTCQSCGERYDPEAMLAWMQGQIMGRLVTAREGAGLLAKFGLPVALNTVKQWPKRGRIAPHGKDAKGEATYLFDDLVTLAAKGGARSA